MNCFGSEDTNEPIEPYAIGSIVPAPSTNSGQALAQNARTGYPQFQNGKKNGAWKDGPPAVPKSGENNGASSVCPRIPSRIPSHRFLILSEGVADVGGGLALSGRFTIRIEERSDKTISELPAVHVEGIEAIADRHFSQKDKSACLCSPFDESEFFQPEFQFRAFLEQLVIPFLYGQVFYSENRHWPWSEYAHGATGLLQAYSEIAGEARPADCIQRLAQYKDVWPRIRAALQQKPYMKGHTPCFCVKQDQIRRCHPSALRGALRLQHDVRELGMPLL